MKTITLTPDASGMVDWPTLSNDKKSVVTIGSFDGMHQGHQAVVRRVVEPRQEGAVLLRGGAIRSAPCIGTRLRGEERRSGAAGRHG